MKKSTKRILALIAAVLLTVSALLALSSCKKKDTFTYGLTADDMGDTDYSPVRYLTRLLNHDPALKEKFIAATRGYNMFAEDFDDANLSAPVTGFSYTAIDRILGELADKTSGDSKDFLLGLKQGEEKALTEAEINSIVDLMAVNVSLTRDKGLGPTLMFWVGSFLKWLTKLTGGYYALSIFIFALLIKIVFLPFSIKQQKTQIKSARLQPKIEAIKAKYKGRNDQATVRKMQEEIMALQQAEGASPLSGCLPLLIQFPIIIALYNIITDPIRYVLGQSQALSSALTTYVTTARAAGGLGLSVTGGRSTIQVLSAVSGNLEGLKNFAFIKNAGECYDALAGVTMPNFSLLGKSLAETPSLKNFSILVLIPVLAAAAQWLTMFLTRKWGGNQQQAAVADAQTNASMKMMDLIFPAMTLFMAFSFSAMLGLYWIYQSILAIGQTYLLNKFMPMPKFTEEELKAMKKAQKEAEKQQRAIIKEQPKYKSLHYIDEDDYDDLPELETKSDKKVKPAVSDLPEIKD